MRRAGCLFAGLLGLALGVAGALGAWTLYEARLDARLRAQVQAAGLADHVAWDDLDLLPFRAGVALDGVRVSVEPGRPVILAARAACADLELTRGHVTSIRCRADGGEVDLDAAARAAGVPALGGAWGRARVDAESGYHLDASTRTAAADGRLHLPRTASAGCDLALVGVDLGVLEALSEASRRAAVVDPLEDPVGWVAAARDALGAGAGVLGDLALGHLGCDLTDDGLASALRQDPATSLALRGLAQLLLLAVDPAGGDALARFLEGGGTLTLGTKAREPVRMFSTATGILLPGPLALAPLGATGFGLSYQPPSP